MPDLTTKGNWTKLMGGNPPDCWWTTMAYDSRNGFVVMFGGWQQNVGITLGDTWAYEVANDTWRNMDVQPCPQARSGHAMAYDSANGVVVMFGGRTQYWANGGWKDLFFNDTWTYNLSRNAWTNLTPAQSPSPRAEFSMTYDIGSGLIVLYGGHEGNHVDSTETWTYNASTNTWKNQKPTKNPPISRDYGMAYDRQNRVHVLFGGMAWDFGLSCETWAYNLATNSWTRLYTMNNPPARYAFPLACDDSNAETVLFGGLVNGEATNDTWAYNYSTNTWRQVTGSPATPCARTGQAMVYSSRLDRIVLYGGYTTAGGISDSPYRQTWWYDHDNGSWVDHTSWRWLPYNDGQSMVFDSSSGKAVMLTFGGLLNGAWKFNPAERNWSWTETDTNPAVGNYYSMAYDRSRGQIVLFAGFAEDSPENLETTWALNLTTDKWTEKKPASRPPCRNEAAMTYDSARKVMVLFGGHNSTVALNDTWVYDPGANTWTKKVGKNAPSPRFDHSMVYDEASGEIVLFGGCVEDTYESLGDTWTYNISTDAWTQRYQATSPSPRYGCAMTYDSRNELVILDGGFRYDKPFSSAFNETWVYDSSRGQWENKTPVFNPLQRAFHAMAYDDWNGAMLMYEGTSRGTWSCRLNRSFESGNYTSSPSDAGGAALFGKLEWDATAKYNTSVRFQFRSGPNRAGIDTRPFVGPDGTNMTYFNKSGQRLNRTHDGDRWIQYRVSLISDGRGSPVLRSVTVRYNLVHNLSIVSPAPGASWTGKKDITWTLADRDNDTILSDIYLVNSTKSTLLVSGLPRGVSSWNWDTTRFPNGTYRIRIVSRDENPDIPVTIEAFSAEFSLKHPPPPNRPPVTMLVSPQNGAVVTTPTVRLSWTGTDRDGDRLNYSVFLSDAAFDASTPPPPLARTNLTFHEMSGLSNGTTYYWSIVANDSKDDSLLSEVWSFTARPPPPNRPPTVVLLSPEDGSTVARRSVQLRWNGSDPDGSNLIYHVVLADFPFAVQDRPAPQNSTILDHLDVDNLTDKITYYWTVIPFDGQTNGTAVGPWRFTVDVSYGNHPPRITSVPPTSARVGEPYYYNATATDEDGDHLDLSLVAGPAGMLIDPARGKLSWTPSAGQKGQSKVVLKADDGRGGVAEQTFYITVSDKPATMVKPECRILSPLNGSKVRATLTVQGTATTGTYSLLRVEVRIDNGSWATAAGLQNWTFLLDTTKLENGHHDLTARAYDGKNFSNTSMVRITVDNPKAPRNKGFIPGLEAPLIIALIVSAAAANGLARRHRR